MIRRSALSTGFSKRGVELADIGPHLRADERAERRSREAFELAKLRRDRRRRRDEDPGQFADQNALGFVLMRRIEVGKEEADGDRLNSLGL
jgi:hypothetical protein